MHVFEVLSDPVRRRILELLGAGEMASGEVVEAIGAEFGITQAAVSQHLKVLRESGFARVRADAQRRLYSVDAAGLQAVDAWIGQFRSFWEPKLDALATEIARGKRERRKRTNDQTYREEGLGQITHERSHADLPFWSRGCGPTACRGMFDAMFEGFTTFLDRAACLTS